MPVYCKECRDNIGNPAEIGDNNPDIWEHFCSAHPNMDICKRFCSEDTANIDARQEFGKYLEIE